MKFKLELILVIVVIIIFSLLFAGFKAYPILRYYLALRKFEKGDPESVAELIKSTGRFSAYMERRADGMNPQELYRLLEPYRKARKSGKGIPCLDIFSKKAYAVMHCEEIRNSGDSISITAAMVYFPEYNLKTRLVDVLFTCPLHSRSNLAQEIMNRLSEEDVDNLVRKRIETLPEADKKDMNSILGVACEELGSRYYHELSKEAKGLAFFKRSLTFDPARRNSLFWLGRHSHEKNETETAFTYFDNILKFLPEDYWALVNRGHCRDDLGDEKGAMEDYNRCLEIYPEFSRAFKKRGLIKHRKKDFEGALSDYNTAISHDPTDPYPFYHRGRLYFDTGENEKAQADFTRLLNMEAGTGDLAKIARFSFERGLYPQSRALFLRLLENNQVDSTSEYRFYYLCLTHIMEGNAETAKNFAEQRLNEKSVGEWQDSIRLFLAGRMKEKELIELARAEDETRDRELKCEAYFYAGELRLAAGNSKGARDFFQKSVATDVKNFMEYDSSRWELTKLIPFLGIGTESANGSVIVNSTTPGSGADKAGIMKDDVLISIGGVKITGTSEVGPAIKRNNIGDEIEVVVRRSGNDLKLKATLGRRP